MKEHFCPVENTLLSFDGQCNWCGEKEESMIQEALAQRTWVGLTDDEIALIAADCSLVTSSDFYFAKAIESKIKEVNT